MNRADPYLAHLRKKHGLDRGFEGSHVAPGTLPVLIRVGDPGWDPSRYPGLTVTTRIGSVVSGRATAECLDALEEDPDVAAIQASRPGGGPEEGGPLAYVRATGTHIASSGENGENALVGVIDTGIDVLHQTFCDEACRTRIVEIWDQTDVSGVDVPPEGYGRIYTRDQIDGFVAAGAVPAELGRDDGGHGTHVASIAAGRAVGDFEGGVAPGAGIVFVKPSLDVSIRRLGGVGYSKSHIDALQYFDRVAKTNGRPIVVNVSLGQNAGAHDGTSPFEAAFEEFTFSGLRQGRVVVKSAGNERNEHGHAKLAVPSNSGDVLTWMSKSGSRDEDAIELWFKACDDYSFRLVDPQMEKTPEVDRDHPVREGRFSAGNDYRLIHTRYRPDNGDSSLVVTVAQGALGFIRNGNWSLEVIGKDVRTPGEIHAWIERLATGARPLKFTTHQDEEMTLSIPGTARSVISVGAVQASGVVAPYGYSSYGPTRDGRRKPDLCAPGVGILAAKSGTKTETTAMSGTSMAAPFVSGAVALLLSKRVREGEPLLGASQIAAGLAQQTQNFSGHWNHGQGYGLLDVKAFLDAF